MIRWMWGFDKEWQHQAGIKVRKQGRLRMLDLPLSQSQKILSLSVRMLPVRYV